MELADALAENAGHRDEAPVQVFLGRSRRPNARAGAEVDVPVEVLERVFPEVALVLDVLLEEGDRRRHAVRADVLHPAGDARHVGERHGRGEEVADLRLRARPRLQPTITLEVEPVAEEDAGVALLERRVADFLGRSHRPARHRRRCAGNAAGWYRTRAPRPRPSPVPARGRTPDRRRRRRGCRSARAAGRAPSPRRRSGRPGRARAPPRRSPAAGSRSGNRRRVGVGEIDAHGGEQPVAAPLRPPFSFLDDVDPCHRAAFRGVPAPGLEVGQQHLALELLVGARRHRPPDVVRAAALGAEGPPAFEQHEHRQFLRRQPLLVPDRRRRVGRELEDVVAVARQRHQVRELADRRERRAARHLDRHAALEPREIELDRLRRAREVRDAQHGFAVVLAQVREHLAVAGLEENERAAAERLEALADLDQAARPVEQRRRVARLRLDVDRLVAVHRVHDRRQVQLLRVGAREAGVAVRAPLHRRAHAVAVAEIDVVAHADLVAVVEDRRAGHGEAAGTSSARSARGRSRAAGRGGGGCRR